MGVSLGGGSIGHFFLTHDDKNCQKIRIAKQENVSKGVLLIKNIREDDLLVQKGTKKRFMFDENPGQTPVVTAVRKNGFEVVIMLHVCDL